MTKTANKIKTVDLVYMAIGAVLLAVCAWISIPATVPFTLQTFAVFFVLAFLGGKRGTISIIVYILLGLVGIPVFAGFTGGIPKLIGTTGGYIISYIFMGLLFWLSQKLFGTKLVPTIITGVVDLLVCYVFGTAWFMIVYARDSGPIGVGVALGWCVIPFILPDLAKMVVAFVLANRLRKIIHI